jgi:glycosyltransferase involved in cell wall biosynthesis
VNSDSARKRTPLLYLAPWIDYGGTDKNTIDWFRAIDRERFAPSLITTQASLNRRIDEIASLADEIWVLPDLMPAEDMPRFILDFIVSRQIEAVHLMNARLGFDLLPDIACLPNPPGIVAQLHVEEADRSGYVRYLTTRYGNLVDRFSVTSHDLAAAVAGYGVPADKIEVVYIGVDGEAEFSPDAVEPEPLDKAQLQILFPARVVQQKDPLLMVDVARGLRDRGVDFQVHVLGEGDLEDAVREAIAKDKLEERVILHPPTSLPQRWYAAADAVLLTSEFEGVPAVVFEAMAMGVPIVASALPGNVELLGEGYGGLIEPRDVAANYVDALAKLAADSEYRAADGRRLRERALAEFTLRQMAAGHEKLYDEVAAARPTETAAPEPAPAPLRFVDRALFEQPLVSVIVPHYNQARVLGDCIDSIRAQTYPNVELIVVDDCSTETDTAPQLDELEADAGTTVIRLDRNGGPSRARNRALDICKGRYVLPVDADNLLFPDAIERLVEQLVTAGEDIGFIYPQLQFFGNRQERYEPPEYNLYTLLHGNYCDTCSLIDRQVFDAGLRYREEIVLGHEDWEFVLRLAAHGVRGEAAKMPTVRYRKWGFNRSDAVDYAPTPFDETLAAISPFVGAEERIKSAESPSLTLALLSPIGEGEARRRVAANLAAQTALDAELFAPVAGRWEPAAAVPPIRPLPEGAAADPMTALRRVREAMRGSLLGISADPELALLRDPSFVEKVLRRFEVKTGAPQAIAFVDAGVAGRFDFRGLAAAEFDPADVHAVIWRVAAEDELPSGLHADPVDPVGGVARLFAAGAAPLEWRHAPAASPVPAAASADGPRFVQPIGEEAADNALVKPLLPGSGTYEIPRWARSPTWVPPLSGLLVRYREEVGDRRHISTRPAPAGYEVERHLGSLRNTGFEGTAQLIRRGDDFIVVPRDEWRPLAANEENLGYLELAPFPQQKSLALGIHRQTRQNVLICMPGDPFASAVDYVEHLGFVEPFPIEPAYEAPETPAVGIRGLVKTIDLESRRHRYAIGAVPAGELVGELGALADSGLAGAIAAWIVDGQLVTSTHAPPVIRPTAARAARWSVEPAAWRNIAPVGAMTKTALRRSLISASSLRRRSASPAGLPAGPPEGFMFPSQRPGLVPLYAGYHPVTGDQLLVRSFGDVPQLGYEGPYLLGFVKAIAPQTHDFDQRFPHIPWSRRFGSVPRSG